MSDTDNRVVLDVTPEMIKKIAEEQADEGYAQVRRAYDSGFYDDNPEHKQTIARVLEKHEKEKAAREQGTPE